MRMLHKILVGVTAGATAALLVAGPALADPPKGVTPKPTDIVGVGSDTIQYLLDQLSVDYNKTVSSSKPHLYSWDATPTVNIQQGPDRRGQPAPGRAVG